MKMQILTEPGVWESLPPSQLAATRKRLSCAAILTLNSIDPDLSLCPPGNLRCGIRNS